ncbi:MAG: F0F1 ATP synthase subunit alpha, partial [Burkholderiales bacterium]|nr:F0F1 ATP synthase subunit alpha [Burkholderiales bacterium]
APLYTGVTVVDTLIPIGRGQRQLLIGDSGTGKTALALDTVIAQAGQRVRCVCVMIGQKRSEVARVVELLRRHDAMRYTSVVVAEANATPGMKYLAPFAGCAVAEGWMRRGPDTLVVYDDLSSHARAYRELSLLMRRPPGREAYPGDIFFLHARLLERATRLAPALGGGSLTALPIVQTEEGEIAAYIPTNLISITDGQIYFDRRLFAAGVLPAVDVALSVSRIGGKAQHPRIKQEAGQMKLDYLQFLELEVFTRFGTRLEASAQAKIGRGRVLREILKQERLQPRTPAFQLAWMTAFNAGWLDALPPDAVAAALARIEAALAGAPLALDTPREAWLAQLEPALRGAAP